MNQTKGLVRIFEIMRAGLGPELREVQEQTVMDMIAEEQIDFIVLDLSLSFGLALMFADYEVQQRTNRC